MPVFLCLIFFFSMHNAGHFSMLGLGDIVMPGLLLCFVMRYDNYKRQQADTSLPAPIAAPNSLTQKLTYFHCSLIGYFVGKLRFWCINELHYRQHSNHAKYDIWAPFIAPPPLLLLLLNLSLLRVNNFSDKHCFSSRPSYPNHYINL